VGGNQLIVSNMYIQYYTLLVRKGTTTSTYRSNVDTFSPGPMGGGGGGKKFYFFLFF
jgi:hypothetical protein